MASPTAPICHIREDFRSTVPPPVRFTFTTNQYYMYVITNLFSGRNLLKIDSRCLSIVSLPAAAAGFASQPRHTRFVRVTRASQAECYIADEPKTESAEWNQFRGSTQVPTWKPSIRKRTVPSTVA